MFRIQISTNYVIKHGLEALDFVRSFGLEPTSSQVRIYNAKTAWLEVDESFARAWFEPAQRDSVVEVPVSMLMPGDLRLTTMNGDDILVLVDDIAPERVKDLYIAGRFLELHAMLKAQDVDAIPLPRKYRKAAKNKPAIPADDFEDV